MANSVVITGAVEGTLDEAVLIRLVKHAGATPGPIYGKMGKQALLQRLHGYNQAAQFNPWMVIVDLDADADCAPPFRQENLPQPANNMCFRIAVREIEAWLLADRERIAKWLSIARSLIPPDPDALPDPKNVVVTLARNSRRRAIKEDMVPRPGSGRSVGRAYTSQMIQFVSDQTEGWRPQIGANNSNSLARCLSCLRGLLNGLR